MLKQNLHEKRAHILYCRRGNGGWITILQEKGKQWPKRDEQGLHASQCYYGDDRGKYQTSMEIALILGKHNSIGVLMSRYKIFIESH